MNLARVIGHGREVGGKACYAGSMKNHENPERHGRRVFVIKIRSQDASNDHALSSVSRIEPSRRSNIEPGMLHEPQVREQERESNRSVSLG